MSLRSHDEACDGLERETAALQVWDDWLDGRGRPISFREVRGAPVIIVGVERWPVEDG